MIANPGCGAESRFFEDTLGDIRPAHAAQVILTLGTVHAQQEAQRNRYGNITIIKLPLAIPGTHFSCAINRIANPERGRKAVAKRVATIYR